MPTPSESDLQQKREELFAKAKNALRKHGLSSINGRVFDSSFDSLLNIHRKRTVLVVGLNGSDADKSIENERSVELDFKAPSVANLYAANWGMSILGNEFESTLQKRLKGIPSDVKELLFPDLEDVPLAVYTNAYLACSKDVSQLADLLGAARTVDISAASRQFFWEFTVPTVCPSLIVAYGNAEECPSAYRMLQDSINEDCVKKVGEATSFVYNKSAKAK
ncbi:MAG: hypothetical protein RLZZ200_1924 [Pseudomonadota bacterium]|jgi:hypothetical protein